MIKPLLSAIALTVTLMPAVSVAGPATDALASCVADNTTGKDRKDLAKWVFVAMSAHPEIPDGHPNSPAYGHLKLPHLN